MAATHVVTVSGVVRKVGTFEECKAFMSTLPRKGDGVLRPKWRATAPKDQLAVQQLVAQDQKDASAKAFYAVYNLKTGEARVFTSWAAAEPHVKHQPVEHKKFSTRQQAEAFLVKRQETPKPKPSAEARHLQRLLDGEAGYRDFEAGDDSPPW